jgi:hypothetical protein
MADCAEIKTRLDSARAAYDRLINGGAIRVVQDSDGSRVEYTAANSGKLYAYIALLEAQYAGCVAGTSPVATRPLQFFF